MLTFSATCGCLQIFQREIGERFYSQWRPTSRNSKDNLVLLAEFANVSAVHFTVNSSFKFLTSKNKSYCSTLQVLSDQITWHSTVRASCFTMFIFCEHYLPIPYIESKTVILTTPRSIFKFINLDNLKNMYSKNTSDI